MKEVGIMYSIRHNRDRFLSVTENTVLPCILIKCRYNAIVLSSDSK